MRAVLPFLIFAVLLFLYRRKKLDKKKFLVFLLGLVGASVILVTDLAAGDRQEITSLDKNSRENGSEAVPLQVETEDGKREEVTITIPEFRYTEEEADRILEEKAASLDEEILGENRSLRHVDHNLNLMTGFTDSGIVIQWSSTDPAHLQWDGVLLSGIPEQGCAVTLLATLYLQEESLDYQREIVLFPSREASAFARELQEKAEKMNAAAAGQKFLLPDSWSGGKLKWYQETSHTGSALCLLLLAAVLCSAAAGKRKKEEEEKKRKEQLELSYPLLVSKIQLMTGAGLSVRNVFRRLAEMFQKDLAAGKKADPAMEEAAKTWQEIESGVLEQDAYEHLGERCGLPSYRELALLLEQNRKRGGGRLQELLEQEARTAFETRKRKARAEGEKASVKLLLPMGMMLVIVMALILVPAYLSF